MNEIKLTLVLTPKLAIYTLSCEAFNRFLIIGFRGCTKNPENPNQVIVERHTGSEPIVAFVLEKGGLQFLSLDESEDKFKNKDLIPFCPERITARISWPEIRVRNAGTSPSLVLTIDSSLEIDSNNIPSELFDFFWGLICSFAVNKITCTQMSQSMQNRVNVDYKNHIDKNRKAITILEAEISRLQIIIDNKSLEIGRAHV